jgi:UDP-N-acetylglucosamine--N-acetylmuramyl-(pentapeptide) pyrophosphoryl-undecaprenol N-acetylglucosamine transferase
VLVVTPGDAGGRPLASGGSVMMATRVHGGVSGPFVAVARRTNGTGRARRSTQRGVVTHFNRCFEASGGCAARGTPRVVCVDLTRTHRHRGGHRIRDTCARASSIGESIDASSVGTTRAHAARPALRVLFAAGGTGGHVFPAVAVADALVDASNAHKLPNDRIVEIHFAGTAGRQEARLVPEAGYDLHTIPAVALARPLFAHTNVLKNLLIPFRLAYCLWKALGLIQKIKPHVVVGTGGYVSLPICLAAVLKKIPLCVQEQNALPGVANKILAPFAVCVFVAFRAAADTLLRSKTHKIHGNPVRHGLRVIKRRDARRQIRFWFDMKCGVGYDGQLRDDDDDRRDDAEYSTLKGSFPGDTASKKASTRKDFVLLIVGGSLGASAINTAALSAIPSLLKDHANLFIVWQTGAAGFDGSAGSIAEKLRTLSVNESIPHRSVGRKYDANKPHPRLCLVPFIHEMDVAYGACDLVVARAGALTCAELVATYVLRLSQILTHCLPIQD